MIGKIMSACTSPMTFAATCVHINHESDQFLQQIETSAPGIT